MHQRQWLQYIMEVEDYIVSSSIDDGLYECECECERAWRCDGPIVFKRLKKTLWQWNQTKKRNEHENRRKTQTETIDHRLREMKHDGGRVLNEADDMPP